MVLQLLEGVPVSIITYLVKHFLKFFISKNFQESRWRTKVLVVYPTLRYKTLVQPIPRTVGDSRKTFRGLWRWRVRSVYGEKRSEGRWVSRKDDLGNLRSRRDDCGPERTPTPIHYRKRDTNSLMSMIFSYIGEVGKRMDDKFTVHHKNMTPGAWGS